jgi:aminomethyltransferase
VSNALRETSLTDQHRALGARLVPFAGWLMPVQYEGIKKEHEAVRTRAGLFDVSHMGEILIEGPKAVAAVDRLVTNDVSKLETGRALYTVCCDERGHILDDLIVYRLEDEKVLVVCNASNRDKIVGHFAKHLSLETPWNDVSDAWALLALQGPNAVTIMADLGVGRSVLELPYFHVTRASVAGVDLWAARTGYTGEDGFELFCSSEDAVTLWKALLEAGQPHGLQPVGLGARDTLRLEARLMLYGNDITEQTHPLEAGLGWVVKLDAGDFIGRDALRAVKAAGLERKLVGFEMTGRGIARHGYPIVADGNRVGEVTSGSPGPTVGRNIGLGYVPLALGKAGTTLGIEIRGKVVDAVITAYAVEQLGDVTLVDMPAPGEDVQAHERFGDIESVKTVSELFAPVSGEVVEVNADLESSPELVNEGPYEEGWLVTIRPSDQAELDTLMDAAKYEEYLGTLDG